MSEKIISLTEAFDRALKQPELVAQPKSTNRVEIRLVPEDRNMMLRECAGVLRDVVYMRGTVAVMLGRATETGGKRSADKHGKIVELNGVRHRPGSLLFMEAVPGRIAWHLDEHAIFLRHVRREKEWLPQNCPKDVATDIIDNAIYLEFEPCAGIAHVPLLMDGKLVTKPGYHPATGLILDLHGEPIT